MHYFVYFRIKASLDKYQIISAGHNTQLHFEIKQKLVLICCSPLN